jgi:hypothetical protein
MNYQEVFQCLKGVGAFDLSSFALPVSGTQHALFPVVCRAGKVEAEVVNVLTIGRNAYRDSFLTSFHATEERTEKWLINSVAKESSRILFTIRDFQSHDIYGYLGLAFGDESGRYIEGDAIVRVAQKNHGGLMRLALLSLIGWVTQNLGIAEVWVRVLAGNSAVKFYERCGFMEMAEVPLYEVCDVPGVIRSLSEYPSGSNSMLSGRTLKHMKYQSLPGLQSKVSSGCG